MRLWFLVPAFIAFLAVPLRGEQLTCDPAESYGAFAVEIQRLEGDLAVDEYIEPDYPAEPGGVLLFSLDPLFPSTYRFRVKAYTAEGPTPWSEPLVATMPVAPIGLALAGDALVCVPDPGIDLYDLEINGSILADHPAEPDGSLRFPVSLLSPGDLVRARSRLSTTNWSSPWSGTFLVPAPKPKPVPIKPPKKIPPGQAKKEK